MSLSFIGLLYPSLEFCKLDFYFLDFLGLLDLGLFGRLIEFSFDIAIMLDSNDGSCANPVNIVENFMVVSVIRFLDQFSNLSDSSSYEQSIYFRSCLQSQTADQTSRPHCSAILHSLHQTQDRGSSTRAAQARLHHRPS